MASRLSDPAVELKVWNRSRVPEELPLRKRQVASVREAVVGADVVFSMLRDDDASRAVWDAAGGAIAAMRKGSIVVECSTLSPPRILELRAAAEAARLRWLEAPVVGSRPQAEAGALVFLAGGSSAVVEAVSPLLSRMGRVVHVGDSPAGAYAKLIVNALLGAQVAVLAELRGLAQRGDLELGVLAGALETLPVMSPAAKAALAGMLADSFAPLFPVELIEKDLRYAVAAAGSLETRLPVTECVQQVFQRAAASGLCYENLTAVAKLHRPA